MTTEKIETVDSEVKTLSNGDTEIVTETVITETFVIPAENEPVVSEAIIEAVIEENEEKESWQTLSKQLLTVTDLLSSLTLAVTAQQAQLSELLTPQAKPPENAAVPLVVEKSPPETMPEPLPILEPLMIPEPETKKKVPEKSRRWL